MSFKSLEAGCYQKLSHYSPIVYLGKGSFARVLLAKRKDNSSPLAIKILEKANVINERKARNIVRERNIMSKMDCPFIVKMISAFQSTNQVFMVLGYCNGGDLQKLLKKHGKFPAEALPFYVAELSLAIEYLHSKTVLFRDIKPENVLLDSEGHAKLSDFGLAVEGITHWSEGATTVCGTPLYMAPETFLDHRYGFGADWWSIGICAYELLGGMPPYRGSKSSKIFRRITDEPLLLLRQWAPEVKAFISALLTKRYWLRLGVNDGSTEVFAHEFFKPLDIRALRKLKVNAPLEPIISLSKEKLRELGLNGNLTTAQSPMKYNGHSVTHLPSLVGSSPRGGGYAGYSNGQGSGSASPRGGGGGGGADRFSTGGSNGRKGFFSHFSWKKNKSDHGSSGGGGDSNANPNAGNTLTQRVNMGVSEVDLGTNGGANSRLPHYLAPSGKPLSASASAPNMCHFQVDDHDLSKWNDLGVAVPDLSRSPSIAKLRDLQSSTSLSGSLGGNLSTSFGTTTTTHHHSGHHQQLPPVMSPTPGGNSSNGSSAARLSGGNGMYDTTWRQNASGVPSRTNSVAELGGMMDNSTSFSNGTGLNGQFQSQSQTQLWMEQSGLGTGIDPESPTGGIDIPASKVVEIDDVDSWEHHDGFSMSPSQKVNKRQLGGRESEQAQDQAAGDGRETSVGVYFRAFSFDRIQWEQEKAALRQSVSSGNLAGAGAGGSGSSGSGNIGGGGSVGSRLSGMA